MQTKRMNITLPEDLASELRRTIPERSRSKYIAQALRERLTKKKNLERDLIKSAKAQIEIVKEIQEDFKYADADALKYLP